jgi:hypothetical protein
VNVTDMLLEMSDTLSIFTSICYRYHSTYQKLITRQTLQYFYTLVRANNISVAPLPPILCIFIFILALQSLLITFLHFSSFYCLIFPSYSAILSPDSVPLSFLLPLRFPYWPVSYTHGVQSLRNLFTMCTLSLVPQASFLIL